MENIKSFPAWFGGGNLEKKRQLKYVLFRLLTIGEKYGMFEWKESSESRARCHSFSSLGIQGTSKKWRGFVDKTEARLASGSGQLYSGDVYSSTGDLDTNR